MTPLTHKVSRRAQRKKASRARGETSTHQKKAATFHPKSADPPPRRAIHRSAASSNGSAASSNRSATSSNGSGTLICLTEALLGATRALSAGSDSFWARSRPSCRPASPLSTPKRVQLASNLASQRQFLATIPFHEVTARRYDNDRCLRGALALAQSVFYEWRFNAPRFPILGSLGS